MQNGITESLILFQTNVLSFKGPGFIREMSQINYWVTNWLLRRKIWQASGRTLAFILLVSGTSTDNSLLVCQKVY